MLRKLAGKQFRRSLRTADCELAQRRLAGLCKKIGNGFLAENAAVNFKDVARHWLETRQKT